MNMLLRRWGHLIRAAMPDAGARDEQGDFQATAFRQSHLRERLYADFTEDERSIYLASRLNLCGSPEAIVTLVRAVDHVIDRGIPGALVESAYSWAAISRS